MILSTSTQELKLIYRKEGGGYIQNRWQMWLWDPARGCTRAGWGEVFFFFLFFNHSCTVTIVSMVSNHLCKASHQECPRDPFLVHSCL